MRYTHLAQTGAAVAALLIFLGQPAAQAAKTLVAEESGSESSSTLVAKSTAKQAQVRKCPAPAKSYRAAVTNCEGNEQEVAFRSGLLQDTQHLCLATDTTPDGRLHLRFRKGGYLYSPNKNGVYSVSSSQSSTGVLYWEFCEGRLVSATESPLSGRTAKAVSKSKKECPPYVGSFSANLVRCDGYAVGVTFCAGRLQSHHGTLRLMNACRGCTELEFNRAGMLTGPDPNGAYTAYDRSYATRTLHFCDGLLVKVTQ